MNNMNLKTNGTLLELAIDNSFGNDELDNMIQLLIQKGLTYEQIVGALKKEFQEQIQ